MTIAHCGVGDQQLWLCGHPIGQRLRAFAVQQGLGAGCWLCAQSWQAGWTDIVGWHGVPGGLGVAIDRYIGDVCQHFGAAITAFGKLEQIGRVINKFCRVFVRQKDRMLE